GNVHQVAQRLHDGHQGDHKSEKLTCGALAMNRAAGSDQQYDSGGRRSQQLNHRIGQSPDEDELHIRTPVAFVGELELAALIGLSIEYFDDTRRLERLLRYPRHVAHRILDSLTVAPEITINNR